MNTVKEISFFKKLLISYIAIIVIPCISISLVYLNNYDNLIKREIESTYISKIETTSSIIDSIVRDVKNTLMQMSIEPRINDVLSTHISENIYNYSVVYEDYRSRLTYNNLFYSGYIYSVINDRVIDLNGGVYDVKEFFDKDIIYKSLKDDKSLEFYGSRTLTNYLYNPSSAEVMTFSCNIPVNGKNSLGKIIINISKEKFLSKLNIIDNNSENAFIILDSKNQVTYSNINYDKRVLEDFFKGYKINFNKNLDKVEINNKQYFLVYQNNNFDDWTLLKLIPFDIYSNKINNELKNIIKLNLVIFLLSFIMAYVFSLIMYKPLKTLIKNISQKMNINYSKKNEYLAVNNVLEQLIMENSEIKKVINDNESIIKEKMIFNMFNNKNDEKVLINMLKDKGIEFSEPNFIVMVVIVNYEDESFKENYIDLEFVLYSYIKDEFGKHFHIEGAMVGNGKFGFVINTKRSSLEKELRENLIEYCGVINSKLPENMNVNTQFVFGNSYPSLGNVNQSYKKIRDIINYKFIIKKKDIIFLDDIKLRDELQFPMDINYKLKKSVLNSRKEDTSNIIEEIFRNHFNSDIHTMEAIKEMVILMISSINSELVKEGIKAESINKHYILNVTNCKNFGELKLLMNDYTNYAIEVIKNNNSDSIYINKAKQYIKENYGKDISIGDIANYVGLSSGYLSSIFNLEVRKSILEYITDFRLEKGKELLENTDYSIKEISSKIGYNDSHSFIRYFKKKDGITPSEFRKSILKDK